MPKIIIKKPLISEASLEAAKNGKYTFLVERYSSKSEIKHAIEEIYGVKVSGINTSITRGKVKKVGMKRSVGRRSSYKKAIVALKDGSKISDFEVE